MNRLYLFLSIFYSIAAPGQVGNSISDLQPESNLKQSGISTKDNYLFVYDGLYDMTGSAMDLLSVSRLFGRALDELTCKPGNITGFNYCLDNDGYIGRLFIDFGLNLFLNNWLSTIQHECMGHGFRAREFNAEIYHYYTTPGLLGSRAFVDFNKEDLPYYGLLLEETGGSESNTVFSRESFRQSLAGDYFYHYYLFSFINKVDLPLYILGGTPKFGTDEWNNPSHGRDVINYIKAFKSQSTDSEQQIYNSAKKGAIYSLLDPSLLVSIFNYFRDFIIKGRSQVKNPMIRIKDMRFMPFTDFHLTPFGYEYYIGSYLRYNRTLYESYYRWSHGNIDGKSHGFGINVVNAFQYEHFRFDAGFDFWKQDFNILYFESDAARYQNNVFSGKIYLKTFYQIHNTLSLFAQASYKGDGFLLGNPIEKGFNAKIGLGLYF